MKQESKNVLIGGILVVLLLFELHFFHPFAPLYMYPYNECGPDLTCRLVYSTADFIRLMIYGMPILLSGLILDHNL